MSVCPRCLAVERIGGDRSQRAPGCQDEWHEGAWTSSKHPWLLIGVPTRTGLTNECASSLVALVAGLQKANVACSLRIEHRGDLMLARNLLTGRCLSHAKATHLLQIDRDVGNFTTDLVLRLLESREEICGAPYPSREFHAPTLASAIAMGVPAEQWPRFRSPPLLRFLPPDKVTIRASHLLEVEALATGFLITSRRALLKISGRVEEETERRDTRHEGELVSNVWSYEKTERGEHFGEDYAFCARARRAGYRIWADIDSELCHGDGDVYASAPLRTTLLVT